MADPLDFSTVPRRRPVDDFPSFDEESDASAPAEDPTRSPAASGEREFPALAEEPSSAPAGDIFDEIAPRRPVPATTQGFRLSALQGPGRAFFGQEIEAEQASDKAAQKQAEADAKRQSAELRRVQAEERAQVRATNAQIRSEASRSGQLLQPDAEGRLQPVRDEQTGQPLFKERTGKVEYDERGRAFQQQQDRFGRVRLIDPDANARIGGSDDPNDPNLYRQNKQQGWDTLGHVDDLRESKDPAVRQAAEKHAATRRKLVAKASLDAATRTLGETETDVLQKANAAKVLEVKIAARQAEFDRAAEDPVLKEREGGFLGIGASETPRAALLRQQQEQREKELTGLREQLAGVRKAGDEAEARRDLARSDAQAWRHTIDLDNHTGLAEQRRAFLQRTGGNVENDPVLRAIGAKEEQIGSRLSEARKAQEAAQARFDAIRAQGAEAMKAAAQAPTRAEVEADQAQLVSARADLEARAAELQKEAEAFPSRQFASPTEAAAARDDLNKRLAAMRKQQDLFTESAANTAARVDRFNSETLPREQYAAAADALKQSGQPAGPPPKIGAVEQLGKSLQDLAFVPFAGGAKELYDAGSIALKAWRVQEALKAGQEPDAEDLKAVKAFQDESSRESTFGAKVVNLVMNAPAFAGEFMLTGGLATAGKEAGVKALSKAAGWLSTGAARTAVEAAIAKQAARLAGLKVAEEAAVRGGAKALEFGTKAALETASALARMPVVAPLRVAGDTIKGMLPQFEFKGTGDAEKLAAEVKRPGLDFLTSVSKATRDQFVEILSEGTGGALKYFPGADKMAAAWKKLPLANRIESLKLALASQVSKDGQRSVDAFLKAGGFHGVVAEMFEERVGEAMKAGLNVASGEATGYKRPTMEQLAVEALGFGIFGGAMGAVGRAQQVRAEKRELEAGAGQLAAMQKESAAITPETVATVLALPAQVAAPAAEGGAVQAGPVIDDAGTAAQFEKRTGQKVPPEVVASARELSPPEAKSEDVLAKLEQARALAAQAEEARANGDRVGAIEAQREAIAGFQQVEQQVRESDQRIAAAAEIAGLPDYEAPEGQPANPGYTRDLVRALAKISQGHTVEQLTAAERETIEGPTRATANGMPLVHGKGKGLVITDAAIGWLGRTAPAVRALVRSSEQDRIRQLSAPAGEKTAEGASKGAGSSAGRSSGAAPGAPAAGTQGQAAGASSGQATAEGSSEVQTFEVTSSDAQGRETTHTVEATDAKSAREQVAAQLPFGSSVDGARQVEADQEIDPADEAGTARVIERAVQRRSRSGMVSQRTGENIRSTATRYAAALARWSDVLRKAGIRVVVSGEALRSGGAMTQPGVITISAPDIAKELPSTSRSETLPERIVTEEIIHGIALELEARGQLSAAEIWDAMPPSLQQRILNVYGEPIGPTDQRSRLLGHEALRMLVQQRIRMRKDGIWIDGQFTEEANPALWLTVRKALVKLIVGLRDIMAKLRRAKVPENDLQRVEAAVDRLAGILQGLDRADTRSQPSARNEQVIPAAVGSDDRGDQRGNGDDGALGGRLVERRGLHDGADPVAEAEAGGARGGGAEARGATLAGLNVPETPESSAEVGSAPATEAEGQNVDAPRIPPRIASGNSEANAPADASADAPRNALEDPSRIADADAQRNAEENRKRKKDHPPGARVREAEAGEAEGRRAGQQVPEKKDTKKTGIYSENETDDNAEKGHRKDTEKTQTGTPIGTQRGQGLGQEKDANRTTVGRGEDEENKGNTVPTTTVPALAREVGGRTAEFPSSLALDAVGLGEDLEAMRAGAPQERTEAAGRAKARMQRLTAALPGVDGFAIQRAARAYRAAVAEMAGRVSENQGFQAPAFGDFLPQARQAENSGGPLSSPSDGEKTAGKRQEIAAPAIVAEDDGPRLDTPGAPRGPRAFRGSDIVRSDLTPRTNLVAEAGGIRPQTGRSKEARGRASAEYEGWNSLPLWIRKQLTGKLAPDVALAQLIEAGMMPPNASVDDMWAAIQREQESATRLMADAKNQAEQARAFEAAAVERAGGTGQPVVAGTLAPGTVVMIDGEPVRVREVDDEAGVVTFQDGTRFGRQQLDTGETIYVESIEPPSPAPLRSRPAPNGAASNLDADDYALVRTPEFKEWFGDWELVAQRKALTGPPVARVSMGTIQAAAGEKASDAAKRWLAQNPQDSLSRPGLGRVVFDDHSIDTTLGHGFSGPKLNALAAVPEVIRSGVELDDSMDWEGKPLRNRVLAAPILLGARRHTLFARLRADTAEPGSVPRFYVHEAVLEDHVANEKASPFKTGSDPEVFRGKKSGGTGFYLSLARRALAVNPEQVLTAVDENGEPLQRAITIYRKGLIPRGVGALLSRPSVEEKAKPAGIQTASISDAGQRRNYVPQAGFAESIGRSSAPVNVDDAAHEAATSPRNDTPAPTEAQKEAGNFRMGHVRIGGLDISIEHPAGTKRRPEWPVLNSHYGYLKRTEAADGEHIDVFVVPGTSPDFSGRVFVINQRKQDGSFDEHKVVLGAPSRDAAKGRYLTSYPQGWKGLGSITEFPTVREFRQWLDDGDMRRPALLARRSPMENDVLDLLRMLDEDVGLENVDRELAKAKAGKPLANPRPDLAHSTSLGPDIMAIDSARGEAFERQKEADWTRMAEEMLAQDFEGTKRRIMEQAAQGEMLNPVETKAAIRIARRLQAQANTPEKRRELQVLAYGYRAGRSEMARAMRAGVDDLVSPLERYREMMRLAIFTPPPEHRRREDAAKGDPAKLAALMAEDQQRIAKIEAAFKRMGITFEDIFAGEVELTLKGSKIVQNAAQGLSERDKKVLQLWEGGALSAEEVAQQAGVSVPQARAIKRAFLDRLRAQLEAKVRAGATAESLAQEETLALLTTDGDAPAESPQAPKSEAEIAAEIERIINKMGYFSSDRPRKVRKGRPKVVLPPPNAPAGQPQTNVADPVGGGEIPPFGPIPTEQPPLIPEPAPKPVRVPTNDPVGPVPGRAPAEMFPDLPARGNKYVPAAWPAAPAQSTPDVSSAIDMTDVGTVANLQRTAQAAGGNTFDQLIEYWINSILSGPATHVANIGGNLVSSAWEYTIQRGWEAMLNLAYRDLNGPQFGEFKYILKGLVPGIEKGWRMAIKSWETEKDFYKYETIEKREGELPGFEIEKTSQPRAAIGGKLGRVVRMPGRALQAADAFFKFAIGQMEAGAQAYRIAKAEGLAGAALESRIKNLVATPGSEAWIRSLDKVEETVFQSKIGKQDKAAATEQLVRSAREFYGHTEEGDRVERHIRAKAQQDTGHFFDEIVSRFAALRQGPTLGAKLMTFFFPFVAVPYNLLKTGIRKSPFGTAPLIYNLAKAGFFKMAYGRPFFDTFPKAKQVKFLSEQIIAHTLFALLWGMAEGDGADDDKKMILATGSRPSLIDKPGQRDLSERTFGGSRVLRFGGRDGVYIPYGRFEPIGTVFSTIIDTVRTIKAMANGATARDAIDRLFGYMRTQVQEKSFLQGVSDLSKIAGGNGKVGEKAQRAVVTAIVPNLFRQPLRNLDDYGRDSRGGSILDSALYTAFPFGGLAEKRYDATGQPAEKQFAGSPLRVLRVFFPAAQAPDEKLSKLDHALLSWNAQNPGRAWAPEPPSRKYKSVKTGKEAEMTSAEFAEYSRRSGALAMQKLSAIITPSMTRRPTESDLNEVKKAFRDAHAEVRQEMFETKKGPATRPMRTPLPRPGDISSIFGFKN